MIKLNSLLNHASRHKANLVVCPCIEVGSFYFNFNNQHAWNEKVYTISNCLLIMDLVIIIITKPCSNKKNLPLGL
jgi:hypothetical protein